MATKYKNIVGTAFPPYVKKQLQVREEQGGQNTRSPQQLEYLTNRNSYFRLSSAAATGEEKPRKPIIDPFSSDAITATSDQVNSTLSGIFGNPRDKVLTTEGPVIEFDFDSLGSYKTTELYPTTVTKYLHSILTAHFRFISMYFLLLFTLSIYYY